MDEPGPMSSLQATTLSSCRGAFSGDPSKPARPIFQLWKDEEAAGSDRPDLEKREAGGGVGRRRKHYFKAHKITAN